MTMDGVQAMLFGSINPVEDASADELRVCALNVGSPSTERARHLLEWLLATRCNTLVLTEMRPNEGGRLIIAALEAESFHVDCGSGWQSAGHFTVVAAKGLEVTTVQPGPFDPRIVAVDLDTTRGMVRLVGVYAPTNGMSTDSSRRRRDFQRRLLVYLASINQPSLCVAGDPQRRRA